jgi:hypothetical protein
MTIKLRIIFFALLFWGHKPLLSADMQRIKDIQYQLEHAAKIIYDYINIANVGTEPFTASIEGVNFCKVTPEILAQKPIELPFEKLTDKVIIACGKNYTFKYLYNIQKHASKPEFLLIYPRLCINDQYKNPQYHLLPSSRQVNSDGRFCVQLKFSRNFYEGFSGERVRCGAGADEPENVRLLHMELLLYAQPTYDRSFVEKCKSNLEGKDDDLLRLFLCTGAHSYSEPWNKD